LEKGEMGLEVPWFRSSLWMSQGVVAELTVVAELEETP